MQADLSNYAAFMLHLQGELIEGSLGKRKSMRKETTDHVAGLFQQVTTHIAPELVIEIGAHAAEFSREMKHRLPSARVIAFEANPEVFSKHALQVTGTGVEFVRKCIAAENKKLQFHVPVVKRRNAPESERPRRTMGSLMHNTTAMKEVTYEVDGVTLDGFLGSDVNKPKAIWIDVEGAAGSILRGSRAALRTCLALYMELETREQWVNQMLADAVIAELATLGLVPVIRDVQREGWQYNAMFLHVELLRDAEIIRLCSSQYRREPTVLQHIVP
jgi:FkbM family methyltransferase